MARSSVALMALLAASALSSLLPASLAVTSPYVRPAPRPTLSLLPDADVDGQTPQQVHHVQFILHVFCSRELICRVMYVTQRGVSVVAQCSPILTIGKISSV
jgi:hypothetical protein